jgi:hypothetical protein
VPILAGGVVYKGLWNDVPVAIKFMLSSSPDQMNDKFREAVLARYVSHPNVVQVRRGHATCCNMASQVLQACHDTRIIWELLRCCDLPGRLDQ